MLSIRFSPIRRCGQRAERREDVPIPRLHDRPMAVGAVTMLFAAIAAAGSPWDLPEAAHSADWTTVRALLESDAGDVDARGRHGMTALLWASQANHTELARLLLEAGAKPNLGNRYGITPLWLAATNGSAPLVELLIEHGADAAAPLPHGETALMAAARAGDAASIDLLLEAGADPDASESSLGETALMWAAAENHSEAVRALVAGGADPEAKSRVLDLLPMDWEQTGMVSTVLPVGGWTALMLAARQNSQEAVRALIELEVNLDAQDPDGTTALGIAIMNAHYDLAALLLEAGADPNVVDRTGMNALFGAIDMVNLGGEIGRPERPNFSSLDAMDIVRLTLAHGADPNAQLTDAMIARHHGFPDRSLGAGATALMRAAKGHDVESMRLLLDAGADANLAQANGSNVLISFASARPRRSTDAESAAAMREALQLLLEAGVDVNAEGREGETALHQAARQGNAAVVTLLVEHGAQLQARDAAGRTPLDIVSQPGRTQNEAIAELLRRLAEP